MINNLAVSHYLPNLQQSRYMDQIRTIQRRRHDNYQNKRYQKAAIDSFPFGKESIKLSQYVSNKLNNKDQQENVRILQQFRRKAVEGKFHNKHVDLRNSKIMQRYITQNMLPGVTLNPSIVSSFEPELKNYGQLCDSNLYSPLQSTNPQQSYRQPLYNTIDSSGLYNYGHRHTGSNPHQRTISSIRNSQKMTLNTQCQTQDITGQYNLKSSNQLQTQRKIDKQKLHKSKQGLKKLYKLEKMVQELNQQISQNSKYLHHVIRENDKRQSKQLKKVHERHWYSRQQQSRLRSQKQHRPHARTQQKQDNQALRNCKLSTYQLYKNSAKSSFYDKSEGTYNPKPRVKYGSKPTKNRNVFDSYMNPLKVDNYESTKDYNSKDEAHSQTLSIQAIRQHLKLLKKNTDRLQTINLYSLVL